ncbi:E7 early protein [Bos taurus papillomavirus 27]|nr:E7 early protein [Bos taurus papillomavirus 27]QYI89672.1 E7 early protein [Bos taurus papillomavirus 27]
MHDPSKFESSGLQPEEGIVLFLSNIAMDSGNGNNCAPDFVNYQPSQRSGRITQMHDVTTICAYCDLRLRVVVSANSDTLKLLQEAFLRGLTFVCTSCARNKTNNGRT